MVETADFGNGNDRSKFRWLHRSRLRGVFIMQLGPHARSSVAVTGDCASVSDRPASFMAVDYFRLSLASPSKKLADFSVGWIFR